MITLHQGFNSNHSDETINLVKHQPSTTIDFEQEAEIIFNTFLDRLPKATLSILTKKLISEEYFIFLCPHCLELNDVCQCVDISFEENK